MKTVIASILLFIVLGAFIWKGAIGLDPDFGWHIKSGEYIVENGFPYTDPFSYTMPSFPFIDHAWISSILFYYFYPSIGVVGLSFFFVFSLVLSIIILIFLEKCDIRKHIKVRRGVEDVILSPVFPIAMTLFSSFFFVRAQVFSWIFWSWFLIVFLSKNRWKKYKYFLPFLFLVWVNVHGGFAIGIFSLFVYGIVRVYKKDILTSDVLVILFSTLATFVNPYGVFIWKEVIMTVTSPLLRINIGEWRSVFSSLDLVIICLMTFLTVCIIKYRKIFRLEQLILFFFLLTQSILSLKNIPFWTLLSLPLTYSVLDRFSAEVSVIPHGKDRFRKALTISFVIFLIMFLLEFMLNIRTAYAISEVYFYPQKAILYLKNNPPEGELFSEYGWGGYLDWKYPEKKVFIDGRMAIWRSEDLPREELSNAFQSYVSIGKGEESFQQIFNQFNVTTVLWPRQRERDDLIEKIKEIVRVFVPINTQKQFNFLRSLEENNWQKVYEDDVAVIYQKAE